MTPLRDVQEVGKSLRLLFRNRQTFRGQPVIAATIVVWFVVQGDRQLFDQSVYEHPLNGPVERAWTEPRLTVGESPDVLHDPVAVCIAIGQRQQDMEDGRGDEDTRLRILDGSRSLRGGCNHCGYM